ncbi:MAG: TraE/TraK family type IV conjugative transfer system protein [Pseudomonadota bacterium]|jgi:hypothetical protein
MAKLKHPVESIKGAVADTQLSVGRDKSDTIRLWENYKDQSLMWRSLCLIQLPTTLAAIIFAMMLWTTREVTLTVPSKPMPGIYAAQDIPDNEFVNIANDYINLIATYQPRTARRQFEAAAAMLKEPLLSKFREEMINSELGAIENSSRTQVFFTDPLRTTVERRGNDVTVTMIGDRWKVIAGAELPTVTSRFRVTMTTIPRNKLNPYGIVITSVTFKSNTRGEQLTDADDNSMGADR